MGARKSVHGESIFRKLREVVEVVGVPPGLSIHFRLNAALTHAEEFLYRQAADRCIPYL